jgi:hypothetical protein
LRRPAQLARQVLRVCAGLQKRVEDIGSPIRKLPSTPRQEGVRLQVMRDATTLKSQGRLRRHPRINDVTLEHDSLVTGASNGERSRETRNAASGNHHPHVTTLLAPAHARQARMTAAALGTAETGPLRAAN